MEKVNQSQSHLRPFMWVFFGVSLTLLIITSLYPFIPREGDLFGCWYPYVQDWLNHGLGEALKHTDGRGKYPTQAILMIAAMKLSGLPVMESLQYVRIFTASLSFVALFLVLKKLGVKNSWTAGFTALIHYDSTYTGTLVMNVQDSSKPGFFLFAIFFLLSFFSSPSQGWKRPLYFTGFMISSAFLTMVRSVDLLPLLAFIGAWCFYRSPFTRFNLRGFFVSSAPYLKFVLFPLLFLFGLLIFGKMNVGHWGFSDGEKPQIWISRFYLFELRNMAQSGTPWYVTVFHVFAWPFNTVVTKIGNFTFDFLFLDGYLKIIGAYRFIKGIELPGDSLFMKLANGIVGMSLLITVGRRILRDIWCKEIWTAFLYAGLVAWLFWTFVLNHYEPRYWSIIFISWAIGLFGPWMVSLPEEPAQTRKSAALLILLLAAGTWLNFEKLVNVFIPQNYSRQMTVENWKNIAIETCQKNGNFMLEIPYTYWRWTPFRYTVESVCPQLEVICTVGDSSHCAIPANPLHKTVLILSGTTLDPKHEFF